MAEASETISPLAKAREQAQLSSVSVGAYYASRGSMVAGSAFPGLTEADAQDVLQQQQGYLAACKTDFDNAVANGNPDAILSTHALLVGAAGHYAYEHPEQMFSDLVQGAYTAHAILPDTIDSTVRNYAISTSLHGFRNACQATSSKILRMSNDTTPLNPEDRHVISLLLSKDRESDGGMWSAANEQTRLIKDLQQPDWDARQERAEVKLAEDDFYEYTLRPLEMGKDELVDRQQRLVTLAFRQALTAAQFCAERIEFMHFVNCVGREVRQFDVGAQYGNGGEAGAAAITAEMAVEPCRIMMRELDNRLDKQEAALEQEGDEPLSLD